VYVDILTIVLRAIYWLLMPAALLRFQMQLVRAPFRNPVGQFVCAVTDWAVKPLRKILPGRGGYDWASLAAAFLIELLHGLLFDLLSMRLTIIRGAVPEWLLAAVLGLLTAVLTVSLWLVIVTPARGWGGGSRRFPVLPETYEASVFSFYPLASTPLKAHPMTVRHVHFAIKNASTPWRGLCPDRPPPKNRFQQTPTPRGPTRDDARPADAARAAVAVAVAARRRGAQLCQALPQRVQHLVPFVGGSGLGLKG
jgi:YggT family protein